MNDINIVMGTAGHIDHGKTALVQRMTGINTDRLAEEQRRGMTIELGFAPLALPDGRVISIVDVPGHEKFIRNMVSGVTGIDLFLLAIAADEGIMPQTIEHIDILKLLNVKTGVIAITKTDIVDDERLAEVTDEVKNYISDGILAGAPILPVSARTGKGIRDLITTISDIVDSIRIKDRTGLMRLPIDRAFVIEGHGTVVTGTLAGAPICENEEIEIVPSMANARVRAIQVHNTFTRCAQPGQRCALNLSGVKKDEISRGDVVSYKGMLQSVNTVDAYVSVLKTARPIKHGERVRMSIGTSEVMARVRCIGADYIESGSSAYVQIDTEAPVICVRNERFILRSYSPVDTVGGGLVLLVNPPRRKKNSRKELDEMKAEHENDMKAMVMLILRNEAGRARLERKKPDEAFLPPLSLSKLARILSANESAVAGAVGELKKNKKILLLGDKVISSMSLLN